jgi:hypothetical protein
VAPFACASIQHPHDLADNFSPGLSCGVVTLGLELDRARRASGFMSVAELLQLYRDNIIFDPLSTLISPYARIGKGNVFYPCVTLIAGLEAALRSAMKTCFTLAHSRGRGWARRNWELKPVRRLL